MSVSTPRRGLLPAHLKPLPIEVMTFKAGSKNPVTVVMEYCQRRKLEIKFEEYRAGQAGMFGFTCRIGGVMDQYGAGRSKKDAKALAARQTFLAIMNQSYSEPEPKEPTVVKTPGKKASPVVKTPFEKGSPAVRTPGKKGNPAMSTAWRGGLIRNPSHRLTDYYGPYPRMILESARLELLKLIDMREGRGYDALKLKCGIYPDGGRDTNFEGWGEASHYFSCSGEPENYLMDFDIALDASVELNSSSSAMKPSNSVRSLNSPNFSSETVVNHAGESTAIPEATVAFDEDATNDGDKNSSNSDSGLAECNKQTGKETEIVPNTNNIDNTDSDAEGEVNNLDNHTDSIQNLDDNTEVQEKAEIESTEGTIVDASLDRSVIVVEDEDSLENDPIVIDDSFTEAWAVENSTFSANSPIEVDDSSVSSDEGKTETVIELADSAESDAVETVSDDDDDTLRQSIKRKYKEIYDLEEGEIISSDEDDNVEYIGRNSKPDTMNTNAREFKRQKVSKIKLLDNQTDIENNKPDPQVKSGSFFMIDRKPSDMKNANVDKNQNAKGAVNNKVTEDIETKVINGVTDNEVSANAPQTSKNSVVDQDLVKKFKCDFCPTISASKGKIQQHLKDAKHYSSSRVLVNTSGKPVQIIQKDGPKYFEAVFKGPIPVCPEASCSEIFRDIYSCVFHYMKVHKKAQLAYSLAELLGEEIIPCKKDTYDCEMCGVHFSSSQELFQHRKMEKHVQINPRPDSQTMYLCCDCNETYSNLNEVLKHRSRKNNHYKDVRVLHISCMRVKKKLPPFTGVHVTGQTAVETEMNNLQALKSCNKTNATDRQINSRIRYLSKLS